MSGREISMHESAEVRKENCKLLERMYVASIRRSWRKSRGQITKGLVAILRRLDSTLFLISLKVREYLYLGPQMDFGTLSMLCNYMTSFLVVWVCVLF